MSVQIRSYEDLLVWQKAIELVRLVYAVTRKFPKEETFGLSLQLRKAAVSIPSNIAEGHQRKSTKDYLRHLSIARGSLGELRTQILITKVLGYVRSQDFVELTQLTAEEGRLLNGLFNSLNLKSRRGPSP